MSENVNIDYGQIFKNLINSKVEEGLLANERGKPVFLLLKKYGIRGLDAVQFLAEFATACQQFQQGEDGK